MGGNGASIGRDWLRRRDASGPAGNLGALYPLHTGLLTLSLAGTLACSGFLLGIVKRQGAQLDRQDEELRRCYATVQQRTEQIDVARGASLAGAYTRASDEILERLAHLTGALVGSGSAAMDVIEPQDGDAAFHSSSAEVERLVTLLTGLAAVVMAHARRSAPVGRTSLVAERGTRGTELQDGALQTIYAVILELGLAEEDVEADPAGARERIDRSIDRLSGVIEDIRSCIVGAALAG